MINWTVRFENQTWWLAIIPAIALLVQAVLQLFGISWDYTELVGKLAAIVEALFGVLSIIGIIADPTTHGVSDSIQALSYDKPAPNVNEVEEAFVEEKINGKDEGI